MSNCGIAGRARLWARFLPRARDLLIRQFSSPASLLAGKYHVLLRAACVTLIGCILLVSIAPDGFAQDSRGGKGGRGGKAGRGAAGAGAVPVTVATATRQNVPYRLQAIGNVEPISAVAVKARVDGQIVEVNFREGQEVRAGSVLFKIDPRPFEAAVRQSEANALRDAAERDQARSQERRYFELLQKNFISKEAYAQIKTKAQTAEAVVQASRAALDNAKLSLEYCTIRSPIDGFTGKIQISKGNLVKANDSNALVVLNQVHPIYVSFALPEQRLEAIRRYMARGPITVEAAVPEAEKPAASGKLTFIDNAVDQTTGTIKLRASFPNADNALWPGQFVNVIVRLYEQKDAVVIPGQAVQTGPEGQFVFVVKRDMTTEVRKVVVQRTDGDDAIIGNGLAGGEQVVVRGQLRIAPGAKVTIRN